ncbi:MAG: BrnA antitoxin family protein [Deltaproteobacteria bacterium]|nr:BrnA antitoxin family protein [Deltaproteobacteria bacterium]
MRGTRTKRSARTIRDEDIDYSDIPAQTDEQLKQFKPLGRPLIGNKRVLISIRIDSELLKQLKRKADKKGIGYQTLIHEMLGDGLKKNVA